MLRVRATLWGLRRGFEPREGWWLHGVDAGEVNDGKDYQVGTWGSEEKKVLSSH